MDTYRVGIQVTPVAPIRSGPALDAPLQDSDKAVRAQQRLKRRDPPHNLLHYSGHVAALSVAFRDSLLHRRRELARDLQNPMAGGLDRDLHLGLGLDLDLDLNLDLNMNQDPNADMHLDLNLNQDLNLRLDLNVSI